MTNHVFKHPYSAAVSGFRYDQRHLYNIARRQRRRLLKIVAEIEKGMDTQVLSLSETYELRQTITELLALDNMLSDLQSRIGQSYGPIQDRIIHALNRCDKAYGEYPQQLRTYKFPSPVVPPKKGEPL